MLGILAALGLSAAALFVLSRPLKWLWKWAVNGVCGVVVLYLLHWLGASWGLAVPWNPLSIAVSALLGIPGVALILLKLLFFE